MAATKLAEAPLSTKILTGLDLSPPGTEEACHVAPCCAKGVWDPVVSNLVDQSSVYLHPRSAEMVWSQEEPTLQAGPAHWALLLVPRERPLPQGPEVHREAEGSSLLLDKDDQGTNG